MLPSCEVAWVVLVSEYRVGSEALAALDDAGTSLKRGVDDVAGSGEMSDVRGRNTTQLLSVIHSRVDLDICSAFEGLFALAQVIIRFKRRSSVQLWESWKSVITTLSPFLHLCRSRCSSDLSPPNFYTHSFVSFVASPCISISSRGSVSPALQSHPNALVQQAKAASRSASS